MRSRQMAGFDAVYVPGWDCHGLPIEHNVDKELGAEKSTLSMVQVRKRCRRYAEKFIDIQREEFKRLGVMGEWSNPYLTMNYAYEAIIARECGKFAQDGSLFKSKKPIYWCNHCQTALAEAEIEYYDAASPSIYVKFALQDDLGAALPALAGRKVFLVIWTTTPWTIPANLAVALHPDFDYVAVDTRNGEVLVLARELVAACMQTFGVPDYEILAAVNPRELERKRCRHPLYDRDSLIVLGDHVTLEAGTGCVHTAPGHGREDYEVGLQYDIDAYSPVDDQGRFTDEVGFFSGQFVFDANPNINAKLKSQGALLAEEQISHAYPHCWRCKQPVIFRATPQWFISMEKTGLRQKALTEIDRVQWVPRWGRERIYGMIENRPDWCVSRQRAWGVPITAFQCADCGEILATREVFDHVYALFKVHGADIWFEKPAAELLPPETVCNGCGGRNLEKETDILDVWFDSGVSHAAVLEQRPYLKWPADLYLEGSDQHRGLVPQLASDGGRHPRAGPLPLGAHPRLRGGRRRQEDVQVPGQHHRPQGGHRSLRGRDPAPVGVRLGLPRRHPDIPTKSSTSSATPTAGSATPAGFCWATSQTSTRRGTRWRRRPCRRSTASPCTGFSCWFRGPARPTTPTSFI